MSLLKFFAGIDGAMQPLSPQDAAADLRDPFASNVLLALPPAQWPQSLRAVADLFPSSDNLVFLVGDGGQVRGAQEGQVWPGLRVEGMRGCVAPADAGSQVGGGRKGQLPARQGLLAVRYSHPGSVHAAHPTGAMTPCCQPR